MRNFREYLLRLARGRSLTMSILSILFLLTLGMMFLMLVRLQTIDNTYPPRIVTIQESAQRVTEAHLWLEEILSGDSRYHIENVTIAVKAGDEGKLFGSVGTADIADAAQQAGIELSRQEIRLPGGAFRNTGSYEVEIHLHPDVDAQLTVNVIAEE